MPPGSPLCCHAPAAGHGEVPAPGKVPVNGNPEGKGETHSRARTFPPRRPDGVHKTPWKHNTTSSTFVGKTFHLTPPLRSLRGCPKPPHHGETGPLPQHPPAPGTAHPTAIPAPGPSHGEMGKARPGPLPCLPSPPPAGPGWTAPLRAPPVAAPNRSGSPGQAAESKPGTGHDRPGVPRRGARGPGEGTPPGGRGGLGGGEPPALINHWELTAGKAGARPGSPRGRPRGGRLLGAGSRAEPGPGSGGGYGRARRPGRGSP